MTQAQQKLVTDNIPFAVDFSKRWFPLVSESLPFDDIKQEALAGMCEAAKRFDPNRGAKFITYASWWIRCYVNRYILYHYAAVRIPATRHTIEVECKACGHEYLASHIVFICPLCDYRQTRFPLVIVRDMEGWAASEGPATDEQAARDMDCRFIEKLLAPLSDRDKLILRLRFVDELTLNQVGEVVGLSSERVRQLTGKAMARVRKNAGHHLCREVHPRRSYSGDVGNVPAA